MKAVCWNGIHDVRVETVPDPEIINPRDAIVRITTTAICGSDLHLYDGYIPTMEPGDILGHEFMGEVVEVGDRRAVDDELPARVDGVAALRIVVAPDVRRADEPAGGVLELRLRRQIGALRRAERGACRA